MIWSNYNKTSYVMKPHRHDMHEFFVCLNNVGVQHIEGRSCAFRRGRAFMLYSGCRHHIEFNPDALSEFVFVCFDKNYLARAGYIYLQEQLEKGQKEACYFSVANPELLETNVSTISLLHKEISIPGLLRDEMINVLLVQLLVAFFRNAGPPTSPEEKSSLKRAEIIKFCRSIAKNPEIELTIEQAARRTKMCRSEFATLIKNATGFTWRKYVLDCRLHKAVELLANEDMTVSETAFSCGFNNIGYFHRCFQDKYGKSPAKMRNALQKNRYPKMLKEY